MKISWKSAVLTALLSLIPWNSSAQVEKITDAVYRDHLKDLPVLIKETENPYLKNHLAALKPDTELKLVSELLLNDEDLIKVDTERVQNYARITEKDGKISYFWITPPTEIDRRFGIQAWYRESAFHCMTPNFRDAKTLQSVTLNRGEFKQFFLTVHTQKGQKPGLYSGSVFMIRDGVELGTIPVQIRVLLFVLPQPAAYGDVNKPFLVSSYNCVNLKMFNTQNGFDMKLAKKQLYNVLENQVKHNQTMHWVPDSSSLYEHWLTLDIMRRCGMRMDYVMCGRPLRIGNTPMDSCSY